MKKNLRQSLSYALGRINSCTEEILRKVLLFFLLFTSDTCHVSAQQLQTSALRQAKSVTNEKASHTQVKKEIDLQRKTGLARAKFGIYSSRVKLGVISDNNDTSPTILILISTSPAGICHLLLIRFVFPNGYCVISFKSYA